MKFFKHFTDAHRGKSLKQLKRRYGFSAVGRYWTLVEMCAEKLVKEKEEEFTETHCLFEFEATHFMQSLGYANRKQASSYLQALVELGLCSPQADLKLTSSCAQADGELISCYMPKLLECLDRDAKRARTERATPALKKKIKNKKKSRETEVSFTNSEDLKTALGEEWLQSFNDLYPDALYRERELKKAFRHFALDNPEKCPKTLSGWKQKISAWFSRGWDSHQASLPLLRASGVVPDPKAEYLRKNGLVER